MGFLAQVTSVARATRMRAESDDPFAKLYSGYVPPEWYGRLSTAGVRVTPHLAMNLSAMYSGVTMIGRDLSTCSLQTFREREDGGKDKVRPRAGASGLPGLAYRLRYQPNGQQTSTEFFLSMIAQYLLRSVAYAEIVPGPSGAVGQLLPRHPDRVTAERMPTGRFRYQLTEADGSKRPVTQDEMFVVRDLSFDGGLTPMSRVTYGTESIGSAIATQRAAAKFFKSGMTSALLATYTDPGGNDEFDEAALHASISRYAAGIENSFGLMLVPDDVKVSNLSPDPEKAQMMLAQEWGVREVARLLQMPPHKLGITGSVTYASQVQAALEYIITTLRTIAVAFEQATKRDLILEQDANAEFNLAALMRGDFESQSKYLEKFIRNRIMYPSEARVILNMNPDEELDRLSAQDFQPGKPKGSGGATPTEILQASGYSVREVLVAHDNAERCMKRERERVEQLAKRHANDVPAWQAGLRDFMGDHAEYVARTMRIPKAIAREVCAQHGSAIEAAGVVLMSESWERLETEELTALSLDYERRAA